MRTIPTLLAAAAIAVGSVALTVPVAPVASAVCTSMAEILAPGSTCWQNPAVKPAPASAPAVKAAPAPAAVAAPKPPVVAPAPVVVAPNPCPALNSIVTDPALLGPGGCNPNLGSTPASAPVSVPASTPTSGLSPTMQAQMAPLLSAVACVMNSPTGKCPTTATATPAATTPAAKATTTQLTAQLTAQLTCTASGTPCPQAANAAGSSTPTAGTPVVVQTPGSNTAVVMSAPSNSLQSMIMQDLPSLYCTFYPSGCDPLATAILTGSGPLPAGSTTTVLPNGTTVVADVSPAPQEAPPLFQPIPNVPVPNPPGEVDLNPPPPPLPPPAPEGPVTIEPAGSEAMFHCSNWVFANSAACVGLSLPPDYVADTNPVTSAGPTGSCELTYFPGITNPLCTPPCYMVEGSAPGTDQIETENPKLLAGQPCNSAGGYARSTAR